MLGEYCGRRWFYGLGVFICSAIALEASCALAQSNIVPDNTLGTENSNVIPNFNGRPIEVIDGGALRGQNLFHSFLEFNVSQGRGAYFYSPNVQNIVTRVTGSDRTFNDRVTQFGTRVGTIDAASGLFVLSQGSGIAGDIEVTSPQIRLDNTGTINATSASGNGGNINLKVSDLLLLRRGSQISATAGTARQGGDGGNIDINSKYIIAIPEEDSDITANAFSGRGGNVLINSQGIFGIESRPRRTEKSDITASSDLGVAGVINLIAPDNSALQNSLSELPQNSIDTNALIANSCIVRTSAKEGSFTITGSGGLPNRPGDVSASLYSTGDVRDIPGNSTSWKKGDPIVEPTGVYRLSNGRLVMSRECL